MILKVLWESLSVALLLYGSYLIYVYVWFSIHRILKINLLFSKVIAGLIVGSILLYSFFKWLNKKIKEVKEQKKNEDNRQT